MADIQEYTFEGEVSYAFIIKPNRYGKYSMNFYPKSDADRKAVKATGLRNSVKEDDRGFYYTFRSEIAPSVTDSKGEPVKDFIGDGSSVKATLTVERFTSATHGEITRGKLVGVVVTNLVPYVKKEGTATMGGVPA